MAFDNQENQPYIELLKKTMPDEQKQIPSQQPQGEEYLLQQKRLLEQQSDERPLRPGESYIQKLKDTDPVLIEQKSNPQDVKTGSFIEREKTILSPKKNESAISKVKSGSSELELERPGEIDGAWGLRLGTGMLRARNITTTSSTTATSRSFTDVYGTKYRPSLNLFYEFQPVHHNWLGALGIQAGLGLTFDKGTGQFATSNLANEKSSLAFGASSRTQVTFLTFPLSLGGVYRFHLLKFLRPFVYAGANFIPYFETRSDSQDGHRGFSLAAELRGGLSFMLDFLSDQSAWNLYDEQGIKHFYLTVDYIRQLPLTGDVSFEVSGLFIGFMAEY